MKLTCYKKISFDSSASLAKVLAYSRRKPARRSVAWLKNLAEVEDRLMFPIPPLDVLPDKIEDIYRHNYVRGKKRS